MVIDRAHDGESVFEVFAARARRRSRKSLLDQTIACSLAGGLVMLFAAGWWPVAAMLAGAGSYAGWGLLDRLPRSRGTRLALRALAAMATALLLLSLAGIGLAAFTGDGRSPYGMCYDANGRAFSCDARGVRRS